MCCVRHARLTPTIPVVASFVCIDVTFWTCALRWDSLYARDCAISCSKVRAFGFTAGCVLIKVKRVISRLTFCVYVTCRCSERSEDYDRRCDSRLAIQPFHGSSRPRLLAVVVTRTFAALPEPNAVPDAVTIPRSQTTSPKPLFAFAAPSADILSAMFCLLWLYRFS